MKTKTLLRRVLCTVLTVMILFSLAVPAFADDSVWYCPECGRKCTGNFCPKDGTAKPSDIPTNSGSTSGSKTPSVQDIKDLGLEKKMDLPAQKDYLNSYRTMYVNTWKAQVYSYITSGKTTCIDKLSNGTEVTAIAQGKTMTCVIYDVSGGKMAGWITSTNLTTKNPNGSSSTSGSSSSGNSAAQNGEDYVAECGWLGYVQMPNDSSWLKNYQTKYVNVWKAQVYSYTKSGQQKVIEKIDNGTEVLVLAEQNGMSFVSYDSEDLCETVCGWITSSNLSLSK